jgi:AhpD family alkylhydroperoxidase
LAEAPIALKAYLHLTALLGKSSLTAVEQQVMMLAGSYSNECRYCIAAHSAVAAKVKMPADILDGLRAGKQLADARMPNSSRPCRRRPVFRSRSVCSPFDYRSRTSFVGYALAEAGYVTCLPLTCANGVSE